MQDIHWDKDGLPCCVVHASPLSSPATSLAALCMFCKHNVATGIWAISGTAFGHEWTHYKSLCAACGFTATTRTIFAPCVHKKGAKVPAGHVCKGFSVQYIQRCTLYRDGRAFAALWVERLKLD